MGRLTMTYEEREKQLCRECSMKETCPYIPRKMEYKCQHLSDTMNGWERGYRDAIDKACDAYCRLCDTKECGDTGECDWAEKFRKRLMR